MLNNNQEKIKSQVWKQKAANLLALLSSTGILFCCILPMIITAIAGGSAIASLISVFPWLSPLSHFKIWIFFGASLLIIFSGILIYRPKGKVARLITGGRGVDIPGKLQKVMFWASMAIFLAATLAMPLIKLI